jgi:hypothetical protein
MGKVVAHPVGTLFMELKAQLRQLEQRVDAQSLVIGWLLARCDADQALRFLSTQANELDQPASRRKHQETIALLDELRAEVSRWHAQWSGGRIPPN